MAKTYIFGHKNPDTDAISSQFYGRIRTTLEVIQEPKHTVLGDVNAKSIRVRYINVPASGIING